MAYNNNNYNKPYKANRNTDTTSTQGFMLTNQAAGKFLEFNFYGKTASISIGTVPSGTMIDWDARKNAQRLTINPTYAAMCDICDMCEDSLANLKSGGVFRPVAVEIPDKNIIVEISNGTNLHISNGLYLVFYKNVDNQKKTNTVDYYPFEGVKYFYNYDHNTGMNTMEYNKFGDFKKFIRGIRASADAFTMAHAHSVCEVRKNEKMTTFKALSAIGAALGVDMTANMKDGKSNGNSSYSKKSYGNNQYPNNRQQYNNNNNNSYRNNPYQQGAAAMMNDEPVDINLDMASLTNVNPSEFN